MVMIVMVVMMLAGSWRGLHLMAPGRFLVRHHCLLFCRPERNTAEGAKSVRTWIVPAAGGADPAFRRLCHHAGVLPIHLQRQPLNGLQRSSNRFLPRLGAVQIVLELLKEVVHRRVALQFFLRPRWG